MLLLFCVCEHALPFIELTKHFSCRSDIIYNFYHLLLVLYWCIQEGEEEATVFCDENRNFVYKKILYKILTYLLASLFKQKKSKQMFFVCLKDTNQTEERKEGREKLSFEWMRKWRHEWEVEWCHWTLKLVLGKFCLSQGVRASQAFDHHRIILLHFKFHQRSKSPQPFWIENALQNIPNI